MSDQAAVTQMEMPKHGMFCWNELATDNLESCQAFYAELFGWKIRESKTTVENFKYLEFGTNEERGFGGMYQMSEQWRDAEGKMPPPHWMTYISVDDVDAAAAKVWDLGGKVCVPPTDIPNVGRFCIVNDPTGATFSLITLKAPQA